MVHAIGVALVVVGAVETVAAEKVVGFAHGDGVETRLLQKVHGGGPGGDQAVVMAVGGADKGVGGVAHVRAGDDSAHGDLRAVDELARVFADAVELV